MHMYNYNQYIKYLRWDMRPGYVHLLVKKSCDLPRFGPAQDVRSVSESARKG